MEKKTAAILTLGCRLNQADSALLGDRLRSLGFEIVPHDSSASPHLIIVNSCAVTSTAARKSRQALKAIRCENPQSFIVLTGCAAEMEFELPENMDDECNLILKNEQKKELAKILPRYLAYLDPPTQKATKSKPEFPVFHERAQSVFPFKTRAILKVQEGCDNNCTYCIVPKARGHERSRDLEETLADFKQLVEQGFKEIVLSGVNICNYDCNGIKLPELLKKLMEIPGDYRLRLSSTEPGPILPDLIKVMAEHPDKICAFLHLPLQNGSDEILEAMGRKYTTAEFAGIAELARKEIPNLHLGTDLIAGFPGETEKTFRASLEFLRKMEFANIHVFPFSPRKGTPAASMADRTTGDELKDRLERLKEIKEKMSAAFAQKLIGTEDYVLIETVLPNNICKGWSGNYVRTNFILPGAKSGDMIRVKFQKILHDGSLCAVPVK